MWPRRAAVVPDRRPRALFAQPVAAILLDTIADAAAAEAVAAARRDHPGHQKLVPLYGRSAGHHRRRRLPRRRHDPEDHRAPSGPACIRRTWITWAPGCSSRASAVPLRFRSDLQVIILCSNWTRTRTDSAISPVLPGLSMTRCSVRHRWDISAKRRRFPPSEIVN